MIRCDIPFIKTNAMNRRRRQLTDDNTTTNNIYNGINDPHAQRMRPRLQPAKFRSSPQASRKVSPYDDIRNRYVSPYDSLRMTRSDPVRFCAIPVCPCLLIFGSIPLIYHLHGWPTALRQPNLLWTVPAAVRLTAARGRILQRQPFSAHA
jgi:hypothetical protein